MPKKIRTWEIVLASFVGGTFLCLADILFNEWPVTTKIARYLGTHLGEGFDSSLFELIAFVVMIMLGVGLCFVFQPKNRPAAFGQGSSVIAVLISMNTGSSIVGAASGQTMQLDTTAQIAVTPPRAYGPLGIGTVLTGRSVATDQTVMLRAPLAVNCQEILTIGQDSYCIVPLSQIAPSVTDRSLFQGLEANQQIWIRSDTAN